MIILKSIGAFFVRIWRWIKETAWVQPLLIVGAIFAIISSIPSITKAVQGWNNSTSDAWLLKYRTSLEGEPLDSSTSSDASKLTAAIDKANTSMSEEDINALNKEYGKKFFVVYVASTDVKTVSDSFRFLADNWKKSNYKLDLHDEESFNFKLHVIYSDQESSNDDDFDNQNSPSAFQRYLWNNKSFFSASESVLEDRPYRINANIEETKYENFGGENTTSTDTKSAENFPKPTILLCDFTNKAITAGMGGVSEVLFSLTGSTDIERAQLLANMWNHTDSYSSYPNNPFLNRQ